jgi:putative ABC transport system substrate-binding protein
MPRETGKQAGLRCNPNLIEDLETSLQRSLSHIWAWISLLSLLWHSLASAAPVPGHVYQLLALDSQSGSPYTDVYVSLIQSLESYGYREDENLSVTYFSAGNDLEQSEEILQQTKDKHYDVIYTGGTVSTMAAKRVFFQSEQPVVFASATDPVGIGVIDGFNQPPKANFTGVCFPAPVKARLRFIHSLFPQAKRFGLVYADMPQSHSYNAWLVSILQEDPVLKGMQILFRPVPLVKGEAGDATMTQLARPIVHELEKQVDVFISANDQLGARQSFSNLIRNQTDKPLIGIVRSDVMDDWGAMAVVFPSHESIGAQAAAMIRDLFEGKPIEQIEPQWPTRYGYAVDLKKAESYGVTLPVGILQLAGENIVR